MIDIPVINKKPRRAHIFARDPNDRYVEPEWVSRRLFAIEHFDGPIHDPACGTGRILAAAAAAGLDASGADINPCIPGVAKIDFFADTTSVPNLVSNPPYVVLRAFVLHALDLAQNKVGLLLPSARLNAAGTWIARTPLRRVYLISPRPSIPPASYLQAGHKAQGGRVDFAWWIWERGYRGYLQLRWLTREQLTRPDSAT